VDAIGSALTMEAQLRYRIELYPHSLDTHIFVPWALYVACQNTSGYLNLARGNVGTIEAALANSS
jgi:hypothetical protein